MITELKLTNFKAFGATQRIPIKPLTLIFGANSSGKSSVIHSLLLANHAQESGNFDVHRPHLAEGTVDLGGFRNYAYRHNDQHSVQMHFELRLSPQSLEKKLIEVGANNVEAAAFSKFTRLGLTFEFYSNLFMLQRIRASLGGRPVLELNCIGKERFEASALPDFASVFADETNRMLKECNPDLTDISLFLQAVEDVYRDGFFQCDGFVVEDPGPDILRRWRVGRAQLAEGNWSGILDFFRDNSDDGDLMHTPEAQTLRFSLSTLLDHGSQELAGLIRSLRYLGPLRQVPNRYFMESTAPDKRMTADIEAWTRILTNGPLRDVVNGWLKDKLNTRYQLMLNRLNDEQGKSRGVFPEFSDSVAEIKLSHLDLGFGMSQVLPVLVEAAAHKERLIAIEQPELHLHPAQQAELGDVFIESALGDRKNTFILETHSEHLILRILRRVRQTASKSKNYPADLPKLVPSEVAVLYVETTPAGSIVREMEINERGEFVKAWPGGFFEEGLREMHD